MMSGWETVATIIGVATVIGSSWVSIYKHNNPKTPKAETEAGMEGRVIRLEGDVTHLLQATERLDGSHREHQDRQDRVIEGIFKVINELRRDVMDLLKELRK